MSSNEDEPTHSIPMPLQRKLKEAKAWFDELESPGITSEAAYNWRGARILEDIVKMCGDAWGFAP